MSLNGLQITRKVDNKAAKLNGFIPRDLPGNAPVRLNLQDSGVFCVVKLDLGVPELSVVNVHQNRHAASGESGGGYTHNLTSISPEQTVSGKLLVLLKGITHDKLGTKES